MKSLLIILFFLGLMPPTMIRPHIGVLAWALSGLMNPHRLVYGVAYSFPFSLMIGGVTLLSFFAHKEDRRPLPWNAPVTILVMLIVWMNVTTVFALVPGAAWSQWDKVMKILLMVLVAMKLIHTKTRIIAFTVVVTSSIAFYGVKGGIFTVLTGGQYIVNGVPNSLIGGNTEISLAILMVFSGIIWMIQMSPNKWLKLVLLGCALAMAAAVIGSYSRGAFLAGGAMLFFLWTKSERKMPALIVMLVMVPTLLAFMPEKYHEKMGTIETYDQDASAMGRINAWYFAFNLAKDHPLTGGGFNTFRPELFYRYAPNPEDFHVAHSIYFQMLGHHGYPGLILFIALGVSTWFMAGRTVRMAKDREDLLWAMRLARAMQVALIAYALGGAFLSLAYLDLYYYHITIVVALNRWVAEALQKPQEEVGASASAPTVAGDVEGEPLRAPGGMEPVMAMAGGMSHRMNPMARSMARAGPGRRRMGANPVAAASGPVQEPTPGSGAARDSALPLRGRRRGGRIEQEKKKSTAASWIAQTLELKRDGADARPSDAARPLAGRRNTRGGHPA